MKRFTFPAGKYYIGDPCYVVANDDWIPLLNNTGCLGCDDSPNYDEGLFTYKGKQCFASGTAYGDGCYSDNRGHAYGVDSGMIGILPEEVCTFGQTVSNEFDNVFEFKHEFEVWEQNGMFFFGKIVIDTGDEQNEHGKIL